MTIQHTTVKNKQQKQLALINIYTIHRKEFICTFGKGKTLPSTSQQVPNVIATITVKALNKHLKK